MKTFLAISFLLFSICTQAQPPLSKRHQKQLAEWEKELAAEAAYKKLVDKADSAFRKKDYPTARMAYFDAIQYNPKQEAWLISKVNDLDILMAENIARSIDSIHRVPIAEARITVDAREPEIATREIAEPVAGITKVEDEPEEEVETSPEISPEATEEKEPEEPEQEEQKDDIPKTPPVVDKKAETPPVSPNQDKEEAQEETNDFLDFSKYEYGITEETFETKNHTVLRIIVKDKLDTIVYKKVRHNWGGEFYFKDDVSIVKRIWEEEVEKYRGKFGSNR